MLIEIDEPSFPIPQLAEAAAAIAPFPLLRFQPGGSLLDLSWDSGSTDRSECRAADRGARHRIPLGRAMSAEPDLPSFDKEDWTGKNVTAVMQKLHAALRARPDAADRLRVRLQSADWSDADTRRLLALIDLYSGGDSRYLNFRGPAGSIRTISYAALLSGPSETADTAIGDLSGKVVFVGVSELHSATQADCTTALFEPEGSCHRRRDRGNGTRRSCRRVGAVPSNGSCGGRNRFGGACDRRCSQLWPHARAPRGRRIVTAAVLVVGWSAFLTEYWMLPVANPLLFQIPVGVLTAAWCFRAEERRRQERMAGAARQYLPEEVVQSLASGPLRGSPRLAGEVRHSVCLASDIEGFTTLSERLPPQAVQSLLNQYFHAMFEVMQRHGGIIPTSPVTGSCPSRVPRSTPHQLAPVLSLRRWRSSMLSRTSILPIPTICCQLGSASMQARRFWVSWVGRCYASTVVGDVANTASRIEGLNKQLGTRLLASEEALNQVTGFVLRPLGEFLLAGKSEPIRVSEVLGGVGDPCTAALAGAFAEAFEAFQSRAWDECVRILESTPALLPR